MGNRRNRVSASGAALRQRIATSWVSRFRGATSSWVSRFQRSYFVGVQIPSPTSWVSRFRPAKPGSECSFLGDAPETVL